MFVHFGSRDSAGFLLWTMTEEELYNMYKGIYVTKQFQPPEVLKYFEEFSFHPDDIIIATYPKSGESSLWMFCVESR